MTTTSTDVEVSAAALMGASPDPNRIYHLDPRALVLGPNARTEARIDSEFRASIVERGVLQPITCYVDDDRLTVYMGQRRTIVAAEVGLATVPVQVLAQRPTDPDRIGDQLIENDQRASITVAERAAAVQQLAAFGLPAAAIAKRTALRRGDVDAALTVATSPVAAAAAAEHDLTLDQAAALVEFADDPATVDHLIAAAEDGGFDHEVEHARDQRREIRDRKELAEQLRAAGVHVLDNRPMNYAEARPLEHLGIAVDAHAGCPGHAANIAWRNEVVDGRYEYRVGPMYWCTQARAQHPDKMPASASTPAAAARQPDVERAEVIERNRQWRAAERVRRRWLREFAQRKSAPAGAERFVAAALLRGDDLIRRALETRHELLRHLLHGRGADDPDARLSLAQLDEVGDHIEEKATAKRAVVVAAATLLAAWESTTSVQTWRSRDGGHRGVDRWYLAQLVAWGYPPSAIERTVLGQADPDGEVGGGQDGASA